MPSGTRTVPLPQRGLLLYSSSKHESNLFELIHESNAVRTEWKPLLLLPHITLLHPWSREGVLRLERRPSDQQPRALTI